MMHVTDHNRQRKAAVINDFASFGRCSLAVSLPILSAMKVQCCPVPTAIFTNHTGFPSYAWTDYTDHMDDYIVEWRRLGLRFDAIATGFLGSQRQIDFVARFLATFRDPRTVVVVDPVMGDYGRLYATYSPALAASMRAFLDVADILTPNLTEACQLAGVRYDETLSDDALEDICGKLAVHATRIVISGIPRGSDLVNFVYEKGAVPQILATPRIGGDRSGTGDVFSAVIVGDAARGVPFGESVRHAIAFTASAVRRSVEMGIPETDGLAIEEVLCELITHPSDVASD